MTHPDGFVVPCGNPLTTESQTSTIFVPSPSYKEVRDVLSMKVNNLSRKEKRKLIKNKRKRIRRKEVTLLANSLIKESQEVEVDESEMKWHEEQERKWEERNRMIEEDQYSRELKAQLEWERKQAERKERALMREIAKRVAEHDSVAPKPPVSKTTTEKTEYCLSYLRTGCCRFGETCKLQHVIPRRSRGVLIHNMYSNPRVRDHEDSLSAYLEYTDEEVQNDYNEFFYDLISELQKFGQLLYVHVCSNSIPHLRGNVYAVWETREEGANALNGLQGRYYAGMQLKVEYLPESVICWTNGICTDYLCGKCARENECSFFHFFSWESKGFVYDEGICCLFHKH
ncbi:u2 small nuclear ribonucleoprotein auxiliary factor [Blastocystis sp. subtype 4]|uniref:u2 small nuclear ribonucleoprotein auxiliary factor n=1 Tax=Blastocystis sp. subtype 4 TaxID=944170 RepID=UPI000711B652|nr:u2 small nuclear ribonucleoprotein auxiliary factor [Blastocystis sp. subtype 4]KNB43253.1 u2 small nuclear ribonucleoprotein auxiliary factor [Blastocystis sp. subtype 4]|eukprot:XP_014526701.1 u2 small nuclear ribonucleoprotein auxiliary factor [Blastocystis sp. subtype 4]